MHHHRRRSPAGRPGGGGDPQLPSARALQGQGREVRRRGHPAQGRQEAVIAMQTSKQLHNRRKQRVRTSIRRTANARPRLSVFRSGKHIYAQVIDDGEGKRSEEHTSELQSLMSISYAVFCWKQKK